MKVNDFLIMLIGVGMLSAGVSAMNVNESESVAGSDVPLMVSEMNESQEIALFLQQEEDIFKIVMMKS